MAANPKIVEARIPCIPFADGVESPLDPCAVLTDGLATVLEQFVVRYESDQDPTAGFVRSSTGHFAAGRDPEALTGAIDALTRRTQEADPAGVGVSPSTIRSVLKRRYETTDLRTADFLVTATRRPFAFNDGTLQVVQNERAAEHVRTSCCGELPGTPAPRLRDLRRGSLNGSL